ncbi:hypothetical protein quinque_007537 [Culex quinquefasciatus]
MIMTIRIYKVSMEPQHGVDRQTPKAIFNTANFDHQRRWPRFPQGPARERNRHFLVSSADFDHQQPWPRFPRGPARERNRHFLVSSADFDHQRPWPGFSRGPPRQFCTWFGMFDKKQMVRIYKVSMEPQHGVDRQTPKAIFNTANFDHQRRWPRFPQGPARERNRHFLVSSADFDHQRPWPRFPQGPARERNRHFLVSSADFDHQRPWQDSLKDQRANGTVTFWSRARTSIISNRGQDSLEDQRANGTVTPWSRVRTSIISDRGQDSLEDHHDNSAHESYKVSMEPQHGVDRQTPKAIFNTANFDHQRPWPRFPEGPARVTEPSMGVSSPCNGTVTSWSRARTSIISNRGQDSLEDQRANGTVTFWSRARTSIISDRGQDSLKDQRANGTVTFWSRARTSIISDLGKIPSRTSARTEQIYKVSMEPQHGVDRQTPKAIFNTANFDHQRPWPRFPEGPARVTEPSMGVSSPCNGTVTSWSRARTSIISNRGQDSLEDQRANGTVTFWSRARTSIISDLGKIPSRTSARTEPSLSGLERGLRSSATVAKIPSRTSARTEPSLSGLERGLRSSATLARFPQGPARERNSHSLVSSADFNYQRPWPGFSRGPPRQFCTWFAMFDKNQMVRIYKVSMEPQHGVDRQTPKAIFNTANFDHQRPWPRFTEGPARVTEPSMGVSSPCNGTVTSWSRARTSIISNRGQDSFEDQRANGTVTFWSRARTSIISDRGQDSLEDHHDNSAHGSECLIRSKW